MRSRTGDAKQVVFGVTRQVAGLAQAQLADARRVVAAARRALARGRTRSAGRLRAVVEELATTIQRTRRLLDQAHTALTVGCPTGPAGWSACTTPTLGRSARGASATRSGFGSKAQVVDNPDGLVLDRQVMIGAHRMRRCWHRPSGGSSPAPGRCHGR
jgi:IS5 family transposase